jgi:hypothetical protein
MEDADRFTGWIINSYSCKYYIPDDDSIIYNTFAPVCSMIQLTEHRHVRPLRDSEMKDVKRARKRLFEGQPQCLEI